MDLVDIIVNRIDGDSELKRPIDALVCFTEPATGKRLGILAAHFALSRLEKSSVTFLHLQEPRDHPFSRGEKASEEKEVETEDEPEIMESDVYQNKIFTDIVEKAEKNKITVRTFIKHSRDRVHDILKTSKEQGCNLVLLGIDFQRFNPALWQKYYRLKNNPTHSESYVFSQFHADEARVLNDIASLTDRNPVATGLFMNRGLEKAAKIFVPILSAADVQMLPYVHFRFAQKEGIELMIWDAIGAIESDPRIQKLYQMIVKKTDGRVMLWDDDLKIEQDFIQQQDLVIMGIDGWGKLLATALPWTDSLPSTLIIKDNTL